MSSGKLVDAARQKRQNQDPSVNLSVGKKGDDRVPPTGSPQAKEHLGTLISCKKILDSPDINNEQKLIKLVSDSELINTIRSILVEGENISENSVLRLTVETSSSDKTAFELVKEDILEIFGKYGTIDNIEVRNKQAFIFYESQVSSLMAKKALNGYRIEELDVTFTLEFVDPSLAKEEALVGTEAEAGKDCLPAPPGLESQAGSTNNSSMMFMKSSQKTQCVPLPSSKLTCRYDIQIDNDRDFQVAKKIIGAKGCNMKQIIDGSLYGTNYDPLKENDLVKLRLRGKGSGFKEGPAKRESDEPLHLCVSAKYHDIYLKACELVETLLAKIYSEYRNYGKSGSPELFVKKVESFIPPPKDPEPQKSKPEQQSRPAGKGSHR